MTLNYLEPFTGDVPGAALLVIRNGALAVSQARGMADLSTKTPCTMKTNFRLASLSKAFTAAAVLMLIERGMCALNDSLANFVEALPVWGGTVTLRHLLSHTSGIWDYEDLLSKEIVEPLKDRDVAALLRGQSEVYFQPGHSFRYSNSGYALLALVVESASGMPFAEFLRTYIFQPLGMRGTVVYEKGVSTVPNRALGYTVANGVATETDQDVTSSVLGDGGIYSSAADLLLWDQAFYGAKLLGPVGVHLCFSDASPTSDFPGSGYGFGWYVTQRRGLQCQWHYGATCGFSSWIERYPARKLTVILLANRRDVELDVIAKRVLDDVW